MTLIYSVWKISPKVKHLLLLSPIFEKDRKKPGKNRMNSIQQSFNENYGLENNIRKKFILWHSTIIDIPPTPTKNETACDNKKFHEKSEKAIAEKNYNSKNSSNDVVNKDEHDFNAEEAGWVSIEVSDIITKSAHDNDKYDNDKYDNGKYDNGKSRNDTIEYDASNEDWEIIHNVMYTKPKMIRKMGK